jgi:hypothetical protein
MKIFLGGTCNESKWRDSLIPYLSKKNIDFFNPVVPNWSEECKFRELQERESADVTVYFITKEMTGVYSIAEAVDDVYQKTGGVIFGYDPEGFTEGQCRSLNSVGELIKRRNGYFVKSMGDLKGAILKLKKTLLKKAQEEYDFPSSEYGTSSEKAIEMLRKHGHEFIIQKNPSHFTIGDRVDYWPSTGTYIDRANKKRGKGLLKVLKYLKHIAETEPKEKKLNRPAPQQARGISFRMNKAEKFKRKTAGEIEMLLMQNLI